MDKKIILGIAIMLIALTAAYMFSSWNAVIEVNKPCIETLYSAPQLNTSAAPYETLYIADTGLEESEIMPSAYKLFKIKLNSDKVNITLKLEIDGAYEYNIVFYITRMDLNPPSLIQYNEVLKLEPGNKTSISTILSKTSSSEYYIWIDGSIKTGNETTTEITIQLYAEPIP